MQDDHTRSVADQQPTQQRQVQRRQREQQAGDVPVTLYDVDLRDMALGDDMPALSDNIEPFLTREGLTDVLRQPVGCTIEALVVGLRACCTNDESVQAVQQLPWWWSAVQMHSLIDNNVLTLGHWAALSDDKRNTWTLIRQLLERRRETAQAAAGIGGVMTELILQRMYEASMRAYDAVVKQVRYIVSVPVHPAEASVRAEGALEAADAMRAHATATTEAAQPQQ